MMSSSQRYEETPLVSLEEAIEPLISLVPGIEQMVDIVTQNGDRIVDYLSNDESTSIRLYALNWKTPQSSFRFILNKTLRSKNQDELVLWFPYLRLFRNALSKLPSVSSHVVYRRLRMDENGEYSKGNIIIWWDFVSCTSSMEFSEDFIYDNEPTILLVIECTSAKDISKYSQNGNDNTIILDLEKKFEVMSSFDYRSQDKFVQLKEIQQKFSPIQLSLTTSNTIYSIRDLQSNINQCPPNLKVDLFRCGLTDKDVDVVVNHAIINKQCQKLLLSKNKITAVGSSRIAQALNNNTTLKLLSLSYNNLSDEGVQFLAETLALDNSKLETLGLHATGITDRCVQYLADMLKKNTTITWLHLGGNKISDLSIHILTNALIEHNKTLKVLDLSKSKLITNSSVDSLVEMIEKNKSLETLWLKYCRISSEEKKRLQQTVASNRRFFLLLV